MNGIKFYILFILATMLINFHSDQGVAAMSDVSIVGYMAYPTPISKPPRCVKESKTDHENINQKQAIAVALGLYLGVKKATSPTTKQDDMNKLCV